MSLEKRTLDDEFKKQPLFTKQDLAREAQLLNIAYQADKKNLLSRYLNSKKVVNLDSNGKIKAVIEGRLQDYKKYSAIYSSWQSAKSK